MGWQALAQMWQSLAAASASSAADATARLAAALARLEDLKAAAGDLPRTDEAFAAVAEFKAASAAVASADESQLHFLDGRTLSRASSELLWTVEPRPKDSDLSSTRSSQGASASSDELKVDVAVSSFATPEPT